MARPDQRLPENVEGPFFVDRSCIDCGTCREIAPAVFTSEGSASEQSYVSRQPPDERGRYRASLALVACPTSSIGTSDRSHARAAATAFPELVEDEVFYCGFASERSFGARSYLIRRAEGNILVDSPRFARPLVRRLEELGGVAQMFLTHRDDVADHARFAAHFGCTRILHARDRTAGTRDVERVVEGDEPLPLGPALAAIPVPGHTAGSMVLAYRDRFLFTGDHLWGTEKGDRLHASRSVCWYSWAEQRTSLRRLLSVPFVWVLPGHGRRWRARSAADARAELLSLCERLG